MPPKVRFTREQIVDTAFEIARTRGVEGVTIRGVAAALGCSIAPIYVNFSRIEDVRQAVADKAIHESRRILSEVDTGNPFRDIGAASVRFARDFPVIFRDLVLTPNEYVPARSDELDPHLVSHMQEDPDLVGLSADDLRTLLLKMRVFHTGFAAATANGLLPKDTGDEEIIELMNEVARDLIAGARSRSDR